MRSFLTISVAMFTGVFGLGACTQGVSLAPDDDPGTVIEVHVTPATDTVVIGSTIRLTGVAVVSAGARAPSLTWRSAAPAIAEVSDGVVRGLAAGTTRILAEAGGKVDTALVWVTLPPPAPVATVTLTPTSISLAVGASARLAAVTRDAQGNILTGRSITWSSNASSTAAVDASGMVSGIAPGTATITATSEGRAATAAVTITASAVPVASVVVTPTSGSIHVGQTLQLTATPRDDGGNVLGGHVVTWTTSDAATATVTGTGLVNAIRAGSVTITATSEGHSASAAITVTSPPAPVASVTVAPETASLVSGQTIQLVATAKDASGAVLTGRIVTWSSSNTNVATVNASGVVEGRGVGSATITATSEGKSGTATITGSLTPVASISLDPTVLSAVVGHSSQITATLRDAAGNILTGRTITWTTSNTAVAVVSSTGVIVGMSAGTAQVTAMCEGRSATVSVSITAPPPGSGGQCGAGWPAAVPAPMPASAGQAFYVAPSGSDANPGTLDSPWKTLQKAFSTLQPGQIAYLRAGTYGTKCAASTFTRAGTASAPITVRGYPGERAVLNGQVRLEGSYMRLSHIVMEGPSCGTWGDTGRLGENLILMIPGKSHHIEVSHSEVFHGGWHAGISAGGDDIWILNNYIHDNGNFNDPDQWNTSHGIYYHDGSRGVVANNIIEHNFAKGLSARYNGNHIMVLNNTIVANGRSGIDITEGTNNWLIANNIVMNNGNTGIHTSGSSGGTTNVLMNNVVWNNGSSGTSHWHTNNTRIDNLVADPLLVNPNDDPPGPWHVGYSNDYRLTAASPAIGYAVATYATPLDLAGVCRLQDGRPDVGALERVP